jgi:hypothetical protein
MNIKALLQQIYSNKGANDFKDKYLGGNEFIFYTLVSVIILYIIVHFISFVFSPPIIIIVSIFIGVSLQKFFKKNPKK